ncbi:hypothetical protein BN1195_03509 [Chryseobacterium oranimense G311]|uniref:hypothetical protein n=1 Tax=Chryseobacterium oranimense TaxID=421058 RepID=UPI000533A0A9|nr:hypothetical protein [Chryseobacterium oranimense]CEJ71165.1 hypothetical protein BN1195_03509 [Chryseobacterium oranimense G311]
MYQKILHLFLCFISIYYFSQLKNDSIVFIGEKISEHGYSPPEIKNDTMKVVYLDYAIKVKYHILNKLTGNYDSDTIEFISFDHYGDFNFTKPKYVLLSVKKTSDGNFYLPKYEFKTVAKSIDGRWAFRGNDIRLDKVLMNKVTFEPMLFEDYFSYIIKSKKRLRKRFPKAYYKKYNGKMIPIRGVYVDKLYKQ